MATKKPAEQPGSESELTEIKIRREKDAKALAELIYDIYQEDKQRRKAGDSELEAS
jgi:hypothetical protein